MISNTELKIECLKLAQAQAKAVGFSATTRQITQIADAYVEYAKSPGIYKSLIRLVKNGIFSSNEARKILGFKE